MRDNFFVSIHSFVFLIGPFELKSCYRFVCSSHSSEPHQLKLIPSYLTNFFDSQAKRELESRMAPSSGRARSYTRRRRRRCGRSKSTKKKTQTERTSWRRPSEKGNERDRCARFIVSRANVAMRAGGAQASAFVPPLLVGRARLPTTLAVVRFHPHEHERTKRAHPTKRNKANEKANGCRRQLADALPAWPALWNHHRQMTLRNNKLKAGVRCAAQDRPSGPLGPEIDQAAARRPPV